MQNLSVKTIVVGVIVAIVVALLVAGGVVLFLINKPDGGTGGRSSAPAPEDTPRTAQAVYQVIADAVAEARSASAISPDNFGTYMLNRLHTQKVCPTDGVKELCWDTDVQGEAGSEGGQPGAILANKASIVGLDNGVEVAPDVWCNGMWIDYNGLADPNVYGEDQFNIIIVYGSKDGQDWCQGIPAGGIQINPDPIRTLIETGSAPAAAEGSEAAEH